ncbi:hypothetical protein ES705_19104 [subsurface metagenome]
MIWNLLNASSLFLISSLNCSSLEDSDTKSLYFPSIIAFSSLSCCKSCSASFFATSASETFVCHFSTEVFSIVSCSLRVLRSLCILDASSFFFSKLFFKSSNSLSRFPFSSSKAEVFCFNVSTSSASLSFSEAISVAFAEAILSFSSSSVKEFFFSSSS